MQYKTDKEIEEEFEARFFLLKPGFSVCKDWTKVLEGTTASYMTLKDFILYQRQQDREAIREFLKKEKADLICEPFNITAEYRLGQIRGYNQALTDLLFFLFGVEQVKEVKSEVLET